MGCRAQTKPCAVSFALLSYTSVRPRLHRWWSTTSAGNFAHASSFLSERLNQKEGVFCVDWWKLFSLIWLPVDDVWNLMDGLLSHVWRLSSLRWQGSWNADTCNVCFPHCASLACFWDSYLSSGNFIVGRVVAMARQWLPLLTQRVARKVDKRLA